MRLIPMIVTIICCAVPFARAAGVAMINSGFEQVVLACVPGPSCYSFQNVVGWTGTGRFYTFKPTVGPGGMFPNGVPEGVNVVALGDAGAGMGNGVIVQTLAATVQPNTTYTLVFSVGSRSDYVFAGYRVELLAGSTIVASDSSLAPPSGTFVVGRILYSSDANPELLGQNLGIRLTGNAGGQADFDKISLDATPTRVSSSITQIASGGSWKTGLTLLNLLSRQTSVNVALRGDDGHPLALPLAITQRGVSREMTVASVDLTIDPGSTILIESEAGAASPTLVGWAELTSSAQVEGFAIFRQRIPGRMDSEGTSPLVSNRSSSLVLPFENKAGFSTGVALVNWTNEAVVVIATIRDDTGAQIGLDAVPLPANGHTSFAVPVRFSVTAGRRGIIEFQNTAGGAITGLGLRFAPGGSFTSIPVLVR